MKKVLMLVMVLCFGLCVGAAWAQQTPFLGDPQPLPGRILWHHYDQGLLNESWYDTNAVHDGSTTWRQDTTVGGGEDNIGWVNDGEWLEFTVDVTPGVYDLTIATCMPNGQTGRSVAFTWEDAADPNFLTIACPETGGWAQSNIVLTTVSDVEITVSGMQTLRTTFLGGSCNYWWFQLAEKYVPVNVSPADEASGVPVGVNTLQWESNATYPPPAGFAGYNVYFSNVLMDVLKRTALLSPGPGTGTSINVTTVPATRYYWSVDTRVADVNDVAGSMWYFDSYSDPPVFTTQPQSTDLYEDCSAVFTVEVTSKNVCDIQWYDGSGPLSNEAGTTLTTGVPGSYYCIATNPVTGETATSATATLTKYSYDLMANLGHYNLGNPADADNGWALQSSSVGGGTIIVTAAGADMWGGEDEGRLVAVPVIGDNIEVIAKVVLTGEGTSGWGGPSNPGSGQQWIKAGVTIRNNLSHNSQHLSLYVSSGNGKAFQGRRTDGGSQNIGSGTGEDYTAPVWARLVREGNAITGYYGSDGVNWTLAPQDLVGGDPIYNPMTLPVDFADPVYVGVVATSHDRALTTVIRFENVQIRAYRAANPSPADGATGVDSTNPITLNWDPDRKTPCPAEYDVYVSADPNVRSVAPVRVSDPMLAIAAGPNQKIYWTVDTVGPNGQGSMWSFETATPITGPEDVSVVEGSNVQLAVEIGAYNSLQWYGPAGMISGQTGKTLNLTNVGTADEGGYYCIANTASGVIQSRTATLDVVLLIGHWPLDEIIRGAGSATTPDISGYGRHGTLLKLDTDPNIQIVAGMIGGAADLNSDALNRQWIDTGLYAADLGIADNSPKSVSVWAYPRAFNDGGIWDVGTRAAAQDWCLRTENESHGDHGWRIQYWSGDYNFNTNEPWGFTEPYSKAFPSLNAWVHFVLTHDGSRTKLYANGQLIVDWAKTVDTGDVMTFRIGVYGPTPDNFFNGLIDDLRLYDGALSADEVASLYWSVFPGTEICNGQPAGDLNNDCQVNLADFAIWAQGWGWCDLLPVNLCD